MCVENRKQEALGMSRVWLLIHKVLSADFHFGGRKTLAVLQLGEIGRHDVAPEMTLGPPNAPSKLLPGNSCRAAGVVAEKLQDRELDAFCHNYEY